VAGEVIGTGEIVITADTSAATTAISATQTAATTASSGIIARFAEASKGVQRSGLVSEAETISAMFIQLGGSVSQVASIATSAIRPLATLTAAMGPAGLAGAAALLAGPAALGASVYALRTLGEGAVSAAAELRDLGYSIGPEATAQLDQYEYGTSQLSQAMDELAVAVGSGAAETLGDLAEIVATGVRSLTDAYEATATLRAELQLVGEAAGTVATLGLYQLAAALWDEALAAGDAAEATGLYANAWGAVENDAKQAEIEGARQNALARKAEAAETAAAAAAAREMAAAMREAEAAEREAAKASAATRAEMMAWLDTSAEQEAQARDATAALWEMRYAMMAGHGAVAESAEQATDAIEEVGAAARAREVTAWASTVSLAADAAGRLTDLWVGSYEDRIAAGEELTAEEARQYRTGLAAGKVAAIAAAGAQATVAGVGVIASLSPYLGPAAVPVGVAIGAGLFAASAAAIAAERPMDYSVSSAGTTPAEQGAQRDALGIDDTPSQGEITPSGGGKPGADPGVTSRSGGGMTLTLDPRLRALRVVTERAGKRRAW
jgi:hypothetical protein